MLFLILFWRVFKSASSSLVRFLFLFTNSFFFDRRITNWRWEGDRCCPILVSASIRALATWLKQLNFLVTCHIFARSPHPPSPLDQCQGVAHHWAVSSSLCSASVEARGWQSRSPLWTLDGLWGRRSPWPPTATAPQRRGPRTSSHEWRGPVGYDGDVWREGSNPEKDVTKSIQHFLEPPQEKESRCTESLNTLCLEWSRCWCCRWAWRWWGVSASRFSGRLKLFPDLGLCICESMNKISLLILFFYFPTCQDNFPTCENNFWN